MTLRSCCRLGWITILVALVALVARTLEVSRARMNLAQLQRDIGTGVVHTFGGFAPPRKYERPPNVVFGDAFRVKQQVEETPLQPIVPPNQSIKRRGKPGTSPPPLLQTPRADPPLLQTPRAELPPSANSELCVRGRCMGLWQAQEDIDRALCGNGVCDEPRETSAMCCQDCACPGTLVCQRDGTKQYACLPKR